MKLKSFKIKSYRSCIETEFNLNESLTCLIGVNGAGKSNILNGIFLLKKIIKFQSNSTNKSDSYTNRCFLDIEFEYNYKILYFKGDIIINFDEFNNDFIQLINLEWNFKNFIEYDKWFNLPRGSFSDFNILDIFDKNNQNISNEQQYASVSDNDSSHVFLLPKEINKESLGKIITVNNIIFDFLNGINYYSASVFSDPSKSPISIEFEDNKPIRISNDYSYHDKFIIDLFNLFKEKDVEYIRYINLVNKSGIGLIDGISFTEVPLPSNKYEVKSADKITVKESNRLLVVPNFIVDGINLSPNQLSEGTFKTLALIFYILNDNSKLLLIEEPEVCVHHGLLSSIIELIKSESKKKQIIISTHSDYVLDHLEPENIILVNRNENKGTTAQSLSKSMSKNDFKALHSYLEESGNLGEYWKSGGFDDE